MKQQDNIPKQDGDFFSLSISNLRDLYLGTNEELRLCADYVPTDSSEEPDMDVRESVLLGFEAQILEQAAKVPLTSSEDVHALIDIWMHATGSTDAEATNPSDQLVLNIFRNLYSEPALKTKLFVA